ncbi:acyl carrier protein [Saccharothrix obliqua]|uniref:acyl carrier protein n=1 Tax=Saccharothrix obliqua TaxID=2861747 RepID=UPI001C5F02C3|nr:acyl carrier protein [Saccharothrix obliqua]MBW4720407.1 acyl carrier protein [Saccharothrix obliqua]
MTTRDRIRQFILSELNWRGTVEELTDDYPLIKRKAVDSLDTLRIATFLEREFGVKVTDADLTNRNFGTIAGLAGFVAARREPSA